MDYAYELSKVMEATRRKESFPPVLTFDRRGWWFDGINYGDDEAKARQARDEYYDPNDLKDVL